MGQTKLNDTQITPAGNDTQIQFNDGDVFNGDASLIWDKTNKMLEIGGANWYTGGGSAPDGIHVTKEGGGVFTTVLLGHSYVDGTDGVTGTPAVGGDRAGGTKASPTAVVNDMGLSRFIGAGYDGTAISGTRAQMLMRAAGNWSSSSHPTKIELYTTPSGSTTRAIALTIGSDGNVNIESGKTYNIAGSPHEHADSEINTTTNTWTPTWGAVAPMTISASSTAYARHIQIGKLVFFWARGTVTTATTASTTITITTPVNPINNGSSAVCVATVVDGTPNVGRGIVSYAGTNLISVVRQVSGVDGNYSLAAGIIIIVSGVYEAA